jgi:hypothetical protein
MSLLYGYMNSLALERRAAGSLGLAHPFQSPGGGTSDPSQRYPHPLSR